MVNFYIYAKDFSGSTHGVTHYHTNGLKTLKQFKIDVDKIEKELWIAGETRPEESKIIYLHWGCKCIEVDEPEIVKKYVEKIGEWGYTDNPQWIVQWMKQNYDMSDKNNKIKLIYIVTDGLLDHRAAESCLIENQDMHYETVVFHALNQHLQSIDLSVAASFFKSRCTVYRNWIMSDDVNILEEFDYNKINTENFTEEKEGLKSYIRLKFIGKTRHDIHSLQEIDKLKNLRKRLFAELTSKPQKTTSQLETKDREVFLREFVNTVWYKNLNSPTQELKVEVDKSISTLINYIESDSKSYSFDALKFEKKYENLVEEEPVVDVDFPPEQEIEFPDVILDDDKGIPVILLAEYNLIDKIVFHKTSEEEVVTPASFNKFRSTMECPLYLLNDPDISESIGYFYTLNVFKQLLAHATRTDPRTRKPFRGGLVLLDTDEFDKYNDYVLSATYFDSRKVNCNIGLLYYVLWKNSENKLWMDRNVVERFKKYVMRRISGTVCRIALSTLPLDPPMRVSLPTALWYCVDLSSCIFKSDPKHFAYERMRMFYGIAHCMIEILKHFGYDLDQKNIDKRRDIIRHVMILKKLPTRGEKVYFLLEKLFKNVNGFLVSEIEKPFNLSKLNYLKMNHKEMISEDVIKEKVHLSEYVHLMHSKDANGMFDICEKTFRPFFTIDENKSFYTELVKSTKRVVIDNDDNKYKINITYEDVDCIEFDKILSFYNLFIRCVKDSEKYPSFDEYIAYILKKKKYKGDLVTIFQPNVYDCAQDVYSRYQSIATKVDVKTFIEVANRNVKRSARVKAEEILKFNSDKDVSDFLCAQDQVFKWRRRNM